MKQSVTTSVYPMIYLFPKCHFCCSNIFCNSCDTDCKSAPWRISIFLDNERWDNTKGCPERVVSYIQGKWANIKLFFLGHPFHPLQHLNKQRISTTFSQRILSCQKQSRTIQLQVLRFLYQTDITN